MSSTSSSDGVPSLLRNDIFDNALRELCALVGRFIKAEPEEALRPHLFLLLPRADGTLRKGIMMVGGDDPHPNYTSGLFRKMGRAFARREDSLVAALLAVEWAAGMRLDGGDAPAPGVTVIGATRDGRRNGCEMAILRDKRGWLVELSPPVYTFCKAGATSQPRLEWLDVFLEGYAAQLTERTAYG